VRAFGLFAGGGGAAEGIRLAGFECVVAVEGWRTAVQTLIANGFRAHWGRVEAFAEDVGAIDLLWASPPCQPYSMNGKRSGDEDERDGWGATLEQVRRVRPRFVVVENVVGSSVDAWVAELRDLGYAWGAAWTLNASRHGVGQERVRRFGVVGPCPVEPPLEREVTTAAHAAPSLRGRWIRVETATARARPCDVAPAPTIAVRPNVYVHDGDIGVRTAGDTLPSSSRILHEREAAALQGFPAGRGFAGDAQARWKQIGNAVPVGLARAIADQIRAVAA